MEMITICKECAGLVEERSHSGNDGCSICQECGIVEGGTEEITLEEYENR